MKDKCERTSVRRVSRRKGLRDIVCLVLIIVLGFFIVVVGKQQYELSVIRSEKAQLRQQIEALKVQQRSAADEKKRLNDPQYIEQVAREQGMVKPGEIPYITNETPTSPDKSKKDDKQ